jgi:hypothetical protein
MKNMWPSNEMHYRLVIDSIVGLQPFITTSGNDNNDNGNDEHYKGPSDSSYHSTRRSTAARGAALPIRFTADFGFAGISRYAR